MASRSAVNSFAASRLWILLIQRLVWRQVFLLTRSEPKG